MSTLLMQFQRLLSARATFSSLTVGAAFRLDTPIGYLGGIYYKTGPESYGLHPDEALWDWLNLVPSVELVPDPITPRERSKTNCLESSTGPVCPASPARRSSRAPRNSKLSTLNSSGK